VPVFGSPVPTMMRFFTMPIAPIAKLGRPFERSVHIAPAFVERHTPPPAAPSRTVLPLASLRSAYIAETRPLPLSQPPRPPG
jgi:hypothetical protein